MLDAKLSEIAARWEWMCDLLEGKTVSEFALSFPEVRQLSDLVQQNHQPSDTARGKKCPNCVTGYFEYILEACPVCGHERR